MQPGERVTAVLRLAKAMSGWSYDEIDMVFKQFGVSWSPSWNGNVEGYVLHHLGDATDSSLSALDHYLGGLDDPTGYIAHVWTGDLFRLFISHSSVDKRFVSDLKTALRSYGVDGFVAHEDITPSADWVKTILSALDTCDALAAVLTDEWVKSTWCDQEAGYCLGMHKLVVPLARGAMPYGFLSEYQAMKCVETDPTDLARRLATTLLRNPLTSARMAEALVANLEGSRSFVETRENMRLVQTITTWTPEMLRRLQASTKNDQVSRAFGVPEAIQAIVTEHSSPPIDDGIPF